MSALSLSIFCSKIRPGPTLSGILSTRSRHQGACGLPLGWSSSGNMSCHTTARQVLIRHSRPWQDVTSYVWIHVNENKTMCAFIVRETEGQPLIRKVFLDLLGGPNNHSLEGELRGRDQERMEPRDRSSERGTSVVVTRRGWNPGTGAERGGPPWL